MLEAQKRGTGGSGLASEPQVVSGHFLHASSHLLLKILSLQEHAAILDPSSPELKTECRGKSHLSVSLFIYPSLEADR